MNRALILSMGVLATTLVSFVALVLVPNWQLEDLTVIAVTNAQGQNLWYPTLNATSGRQIYIGYGCIYCHSQQVRSAPYSDIERGWGARRSVPRDYMLQRPPLLGTMRTGPDLANISSRQPAETWHHLHLYDPRIVSPGSIMPPFRFWYQLVKQDPGSAGIALPASYWGFPAWIIPQQEATELVDYLLSLEQSYTLEQVQ